MSTPHGPVSTLGEAQGVCVSLLYGLGEAQPVPRNLACSDVLHGALQHIQGNLVRLPIRAEVHSMEGMIL